MVAPRALEALAPVDLLPSALARTAPAGKGRAGSRRPRAWIAAVALAAFLAPCHQPLADATWSVASAFPLVCTVWAAVTG